MKTYKQKRSKPDKSHDKYSELFEIAEALVFAEFIKRRAMQRLEAFTAGREKES